MLAERARVDWLLDGIATTLREVTRPFDAAAFGWRRRRGIGAEPPAADRGAAALAEAATTLHAFAALLDPEGYACLGSVHARRRRGGALPAPDSCERK